MWGKSFPHIRALLVDKHISKQKLSRLFPMPVRPLFTCIFSCFIPGTTFNSLKPQQPRFFPTSLQLRTMSIFSHLIRFEADDGKTYYGDLTKETPTRDIEGKNVEVLEGDVKSGFTKKGSRAKVSKLLCPLPTTNIILCVGLNYRKHAEESNVSHSVASSLDILTHVSSSHPLLSQPSLRSPVMPLLGLWTTSRFTKTARATSTTRVN